MDKKRRDSNPEMDTQGFTERFPGPTDGSVESLFRLIPSPEGQRKLWQILELLHPADAGTLVENLLLMSPAPALQTQPEPLRRDCDTVVAALVESLFRLIPSPEEEQRGLWQILESLHPQDSMILVEICAAGEFGFGPADSAGALASGL